MPSNDIVIAAAVRTAVGSFNGSFATLPAHELGRTAITEALKRGKVAPEEVDEVILGQILAAGEGMNPARQASIGAGLPKETTAWEVNQVCGSGLRTVALGMQQIQVGDADIIVAGGQESMSMSPHCAHLRGGVKMGELQMMDTMIRDGLWDIFNGYHMGVTAENVAREYQVTREQQDEFAVPRRTRRKRRRTRATSRRRSSRSPSRPARAMSSSIRTSTFAPARPWRRSPSSGRRSRRTAPSPPAMRPASTTARP